MHRNNASSKTNSSQSSQNRPPINEIRTRVRSISGGSISGGSTSPCSTSSSAASSGHRLPALLLLTGLFFSVSFALGIVMIGPNFLLAYPAKAIGYTSPVTDTNLIHLPILVQVGTTPISSTPTDSTPDDSGATATPSDTPTPLPTNNIEWDPRLDQRGAVLIPAQPAPGQGYWRLVRGQWLNEEESGGRVHIFVDTLDEQANRQTDVPLLVTWADGTTTIVTEAKPGEPAANFAMFTWAPAYDIRPNDGNPADRVNGLGLGSIEQPRFNIHTSYDFTWQWTIYNPATSTPIPTTAATAEVTNTATLVPTDSLTPTPSISTTATVSATPAISATVTITTTPSPSITPTERPTLIPTSTPQPTVTSTPTAEPTATPIPSGTATPVIDDQFTFRRGTLDCSPNQNQTLLNGTVFVNDEPAPGYRVIFDFEVTGDGVTPPQITRENPPGFYEHILGEGSWYVWIVDEIGTRISVQVPFTIDSTEVIEEDRCRVATVEFYDN